MNEAKKGESRRSKNDSSRTKIERAIGRLRGDSVMDQQHPRLPDSSRRFSDPPEAARLGFWIPGVRPPIGHAAIRGD